MRLSAFYSIFQSGINEAATKREKTRNIEPAEKNEKPSDIKATDKSGRTTNMQSPASTAHATVINNDEMMKVVFHYGTINNCASF